jgi:hypothetical protein
LATTPRYDKYDGVTGGFRAKLAADLSVMIKNIPFYPGLGNIAGAANLAVPIGGKAGDVVDVMTEGEIVDVPGLVAGTRYYATAAGAVSATVVAGLLIGWTVEATRLVVRIGRV